MIDLKSIEIGIDLMFHAAKNMEFIRRCKGLKTRRYKSYRSDKRVRRHLGKPLIRRVIFKSKEILFFNHKTQND